MTLVVGYPPEQRSHAVLHLGATLARSSGEDLVVCCVVPRPWFPSMARVDAEYQAELDARADSALDQARSALPNDVKATFLRHAARSAPTGLIEIAEDRDAGMIVVGSSSAGVFGHIVLGSASDRLLHSSPVPVALAARGFRAKPGARVRRITAAYGGTEAAYALAVAAAPVAAQVGASLRLASFAVWSRPSYVMRLGSEGEDAVLSDWLADMQGAASETLEQVKDLPDVPHELESVVGVGASWPEALEDIDWGDGDVLVVGSSPVGSVARVFIGTRASKIVRHSPVPVIVVPRPPAAEPTGSAETPPS